MSDDLSRSYKTEAEAAMGGFRKIINENHPNKFDEFSFFVIAIPGNGQLSFHYTLPQKLGPNGGKNSWKRSKGQLLRAYCHTHPERIKVEDFGSDDAEEFKGQRLAYPFLAWYLLTPKEQIRLAQSEADFNQGKPIGWISAVEP